MTHKRIGKDLPKSERDGGGRARPVVKEDKAFEMLRVRAEAAMDSLLSEVRSSKAQEQRAQAVYEARADSKIKQYKLSDMSRIWVEKPRNRARYWDGPAGKLPVTKSPLFF